MLFRGSGPAKRTIQAKDLLASFINSWHRFYISLDEDALSLYDSKGSTTPYLTFLVKDIEAIKTEQGTSTRRLGSTAAFSEDLVNVIVVTNHGDEVCLR